MEVVSLPHGRLWTAAETDELAARVIAADPDVYIALCATPLPTDGQNSIQLLKRFRTRKWMPRAIVLPIGHSFQASIAMNEERIGDGGRRAAQHNTAQHSSAAQRQEEKKRRKKRTIETSRHGCGS